jgi:hypothetical protein
MSFTEDVEKVELIQDTMSPLLPVVSNAPTNHKALELHHLYGVVPAAIHRAYTRTRM